MCPASQHSGPYFRSFSASLPAAQLHFLQDLLSLVGGRREPASEAQLALCHDLRTILRYIIMYPITPVCGAVGCRLFAGCGPTRLVVAFTAGDLVLPSCCLYLSLGPLDAARARGARVPQPGCVLACFKARLPLIARGCRWRSRGVSGSLYRARP